MALIRLSRTKNKLMQDKTSSPIPRTPKEKRMWIQARRIVAKEVGAKRESEMPWELVTTIYNNAKKANKIPKMADVRDAKFSKTIYKYKYGK